MNYRPLKLGALQIDYPVFLAPMVGYTDCVARTLARWRHCGMAFTEMANSDAIVRSSKSTDHLLTTAPDEFPVGAHIYGSNPDNIIQSAIRLAATGRYHTIDLNCGCPASKIAARGAGAGLMRDPGKIGMIVRGLCAAVSLPVTIKTRLGLTVGNMKIDEIAQAAEENGAAAITIHARFADDRHAGPPDWSALARIKSKLKIPVIGNGGVRMATDALRMLRETGVDGVMIGQAAIGNPWIFEEVWAVLHDQPIKYHSVQEHRQVMEAHLRMLIEHKARAIRNGLRPRRYDAERDAVLLFRAHLAAYIRGFRRSAVWRRRLSELCTLDEVLEILDELRLAPGFDRMVE